MKIVTLTFKDAVDAYSKTVVTQLKSCKDAARRSPDDGLFHNPALLYEKLLFR